MRGREGHGLKHSADLGSYDTPVNISGRLLHQQCLLDRVGTYLHKMWLNVHEIRRMENMLSHKSISQFGQHTEMLFV